MKIVTLLFFLIFSPFLVVGGITVHLPYYYMLLLCIFYTYGAIKNGVRRNEIILITISFLPLYYFLSNAFFHNVYDILVIYESILNVAFVICAIQLVKYTKSNSFDIALYELMRGVFVVGVIHAVIMILVFIIPTFQNFLYSYVYINEVGKEFLELSYRSPGLTTAGGDGLSVFQSISLVFGLYLYLNHKGMDTLVRMLLYIISFAVLIISILLSGRTGFVIFAVGAWLIFSNKILVFSINRKLFFRVLFVLSMLLLIIITLFTFLESSQYSRLFFRAFELVINLVSHGEISSGSTDDLLTMYFLPDAKNQLLFGDGNFGRSESLPFLHSDVGYVRILFGGGVLGLFILFLPVFIMYLYLYFKVKVVECRFVLNFIFITFVVVNFKVLFVFPSSLGIKLLYLFFVFFICSEDRYDSKLNLQNN